jgi:hypothetical protein
MFRKFSRTELIVYIAIVLILGSVIVGIFASKEDAIKRVRQVPELASDLVVAINFNLKRLKTATLAPEVVSPDLRIFTFDPIKKPEDKIDKETKEKASSPPIILKKKTDKPEEPDMALHGPAILPPEMLMPPKEEEEPEEPGEVPEEGPEIKNLTAAFRDPAEDSGEGGGEKEEPSETAKSPWQVIVTTMFPVVTPVIDDIIPAKTSGPEEPEGQTKPEMIAAPPAEPERSPWQDTVKNNFPFVSMLIDNFVSFFSESHPVEEEKIDDFNSHGEPEKGLRDFQTPPIPEEVIPETSGKEPESYLYETEEKEEIYEEDIEDKDHEVKDKDKDKDKFAQTEDREDKKEKQGKKEDTWKDNWKNSDKKLTEKWEDDSKKDEEEDDIDEDGVFRVSIFSEEREEREEGDDRDDEQSYMGSRFFQGLQDLLQKKEVIQESQNHFKQNGASHIKDEDYEIFRGRFGEGDD